MWKNTNRPYHTFFLLSLLLINLSCKNNNENVGLTKTLWKLESYVINNELILIPNQQEYTAYFEEDSMLNGKVFCNTFGGQYQLSENNKIDIRILGHTKINCGDMTHHYQIISLLNNVRKYMIEETYLCLVNGDDKLNYIINE